VLGAQSVLLFVSHLILAKELGATEFGVYSLTFATLSILSIAGTLGGRGTVIRFVSTYLARNEKQKLKGLLIYCNLAGLGTSVMLTIVGLAFFECFPDLFPSDLTATMRVMLYFLPVNVLIIIRKFTTRGFKLLFRSLAPEAIVRPIFFILLIVVAPGIQEMNAQCAFWLYGWASLFSLSVGYLVSYGAVNLPFKGQRAVFEWAEWIRSGLPIILASLVQAVARRIDMYIIALLLPMALVGQYSVALKIAMMINIIQTGIRVWAGPHIASLYAEHDISGLEQFLKKAVRLSTGLALLPVLIIMLFPRPLLSLFGPGYQTAAEVLIILALAEMLHIAFGLAGNVLLMTGCDRLYMLITLGCSVISSITLFLFIRAFGLMGAAYGFILSVIILNVCFNFAAYWRGKLKCYLR
jgi:O-antigen/teichoic acid export membrane protein